MMITKLLAVVLLSGAISTGASGKSVLNGPKMAIPSSFDYSITYSYNASAGSTELWGYTPNGGGIYELIRFRQTSNNWVSFWSSSFYNSTFSISLRIGRNANNDSLFIPDATYAGCYRYQNLGGSFEFYNDRSRQFELYVTMNDSAYLCLYTLDVNATLNYYFRSQNNDLITYVKRLATDTTYDMVSTYSFPSRWFYNRYEKANGAIENNVLGFYFDLVATANIEDEERQQYINQGYIDGYADGKGDGEREGYSRGVIDGQDGAGWNDVFAIFSTAIETVGDVMEITLFGPFTIGALVAIPIVMGLLFWIIEKWRGS